MATDISELRPDTLGNLLSLNPLAPARPLPKPRRGTEILAEDRACNMLIFGDFGTGKTRTIIELLLMGFRVILLRADFGKSGSASIYNWFAAPENAVHRHLLDNLIDVEVGYDSFLAFVRQPVSLIPDFVEFDADFAFLDGFSAWQLVDLEDYITDGDPLREDTDWKDWRSTKNATFMVLTKFLHLDKPNGKPLHKIATLAEEKKSERRKVGKDFEDIPGTAKIGPMLHTSVRALSQAGFDIMFQTRKTADVMGTQEDYTYVFRDVGLMNKARELGLPASMKADFKELWTKYIAPRFAGIKTPAKGK